MTAHNGDSYTYDEWDRLVRFTPQTGAATTYEYDAEGIRVAKNTTRYANDLNKNVAADSNNTQMLWGNGPIAREVDGQWYYYITNAHGDVLALVDDSGNVCNAYQYDAWGNTIQKHETVDNPFCYNGQFTDDETGLIYLRARYYDPHIGRFTQEDPAREDMNWYAFCGNNPINFVDSSGLGYIPLRESALFWGIDTYFDPETKVATLSTGVEFATDDGKGTFIDGTDGKMYVWQEDGVGSSIFYPAGNDTVTDQGGYLYVAAVTIVAGYKLGKYVASFVKASSAAKSATIAATLANAVPAAQRATQSIGNYTVKAKHLMNTGGDWAKFATNSAAQVNVWITQALTNSQTFVANSEDSFYTIYKIGETIGTRGEQAIKVVFTEAGRIITAFPIK